MATTTASPNRTVSTADLSAPELAERLRMAIKTAGGLGHVSAVSGVPVRSLSRFLSGQDVKAQALVALADACGVSLEWLAAGRGPMRPSESRVPLPTKPDAPNAPLTLFTTVNMDRLARCLDAVEAAFGPVSRGAQTRRKVQISALLYDAMMDETSDLNALLNDTIHAVQSEENR